jgi:hypothetical protein
MIRIIGILCGSAVAIAFLIVALGIPEFLPPSEAVEPVEAPPELVTIDSTIDSEIDSKIESMPQAAPPAEAEMPIAELEAPIETIPEPVDETFAETAARAAAMSEPLAENWFAFWSPFRSAIAANGFIAQLQRETGMDYRVVKIKPGVYEVAFAYEGEHDIETKLAKISRATGLEMPDG